MSFGVRVFVVKHCAFYEEFTDVSSVALHFLEPLDGSSGRPGAEMEEIGKFLLIKGLDFGPKPLDDFVFGVELPLVVSVFPPVLDINIGHSIEYHFKFIWLKYTQQVLWYNLIDTILNRSKRPLNRLSTQMFHTKEYKQKHTMTKCRGSYWSH